MNTRPILACAIIASLLTIIPNALAAPAKKPFMLTGNIVYPNGKPAADATVILDIVNNSTHAVKTLTYKPDKNGHVSFAIDTTQFAVSMPVFYFTSPTGIGFWTFDHPMTVTTSTVQPYTKVKIHLVDGSGKPIAHVRICPAIFNMDRSVGWWSDAIPGDWTQTTDASGVATLPKLPQGYVMTLEIRDNRYARPDSASDIHLAKSSITPDATIHLGAAASISGTVTYGPTKKPVAGIGVFASATGFNDMNPPIVTGKDGRYTINRLPAGSYSVQIEDRSKQFTNWTTAPLIVTLTAGTQAAGSDITLVRGGLITGKITDETTCKPLPGIFVIGDLPGPPRDGVDPFATRTADDGTYSLRIVPGSIQLHTIGGAGQPSTQDLDIADGETKTVNFQIKAPIPRTSIHGVVLGPDDKPAAGATVTTNTPNEQDQTFTADSEGRFTTDSTNLASQSTLEVRSGNLGTAAPITYNGENPLTIHLAAGVLCTLNGQVTAADGGPVAHASVSLFRVKDETNIPVDHITADATGHYVFPPWFGNSTYTVRAYAPGYATSWSDSVDVTTGQTVQIPNLALKTAHSYAGGTVLNTQGKPVPGAVVTDISSDNNHVTTDETGRFMLKEVLPISTNVTVRTPDGTYTTAELKSDRSDNIISIPSPLNGIVLGPDGKPVPDAKIYATTENTGYETTTADAKGRFTINTPGLTLKSLVMAKATIQTGDLGTAAPIVYNGEDPLIIHLTPGNLGIIKGQVKSLDGSPIGGADVMIMLTEGNTSSSIDETHTDSQGQFSFPATFGNSKYLVTASAQGYGSYFSDSLQVPAGQTVQAPPITLTPADSFAGGTVFDSTGNPAPNITINDSDVADTKFITDKAGHFMLKNVPRNKTSIWLKTPYGNYSSQDLTSGRGDNIIYLPKPTSQK